MDDSFLLQASSYAGEKERRSIPRDWPEPVDGIPVGHSEEPLVCLELGKHLQYSNHYAALALEGTTVRPYLRASVKRALDTVVASLPPRFGLVVFDAWRSPVTVQSLYDFAVRRDPEAVVGYVADPSNSTTVPPHTTGGAVDLSLTLDGVPLFLGSGFDQFDKFAWTAYYETKDSVWRPLRRLLYWRMIDAGFVNYPLEWWHFSYGDQEWAMKTGQPRALFGATAIA